MAAKFKMSDEEMERELERKFERNRIAFEGWLERKKEEQKKVAAEKRRAARLQLDIAEQKQGVGQAAFRNWLRRKQEEDEFLKKEKTVQREWRRLKEGEKKEKRKRAEESFNTWKLQKDLDLSLQSSNDRHRARSLSPRMREPTPTVPGYCSVWSCDLDLAGYITDHVPRGDNKLTDIKPFVEDNFTIYHDHT